LNPSRDGDSTTALGSLVQRLTTLSVKTFFPISNLNPPCHSLRPLPLVLSLVTWEKRPAPPLTTPSCQAVVESEKVSPQPLLLQTKQPQLPQPLPLRPVLQTLYQPCCPSLDTPTVLPKIPAEGVPLASPVLPMGHKVHLLAEHSQPPTPDAEDDAGPIAHLHFDTRLFLEELDAVKPKEQRSQSQASQEVCCDQQGPRHHDLHWAGKEKKNRKGSEEWSEELFSLLQITACVPARVIQLTSGHVRVYTGSHKLHACHVP